MDGKNTQWTRLALMGLLAAGPVGSAVAEEARAQDARGVYFGIAGGHAWLADRRNPADAGYGVELLVGWRFADNWALEANTNYFNFETGNEGLTDFYRTGFGVDLLWGKSGTGWTPFLLAGVGGAYNDVYPDGQDGLDPVLNFGAGVATKAFGSHGARFRAEVRYVRDWIDGKRVNDKHAYVGLIIPLNAPRIVERVVEREVVREVVQVAPPPPPPPDTDRDGVPDPRDRCPDTLPGTRVDSEGCAVESSVVTLQGVHFETNKDRLTADSTAILAQAAAALKGQPSMKVEVRGHTDSVGSDAYNQSLSAKRAQSVVDFLVNNGIPAGRLTAKGFGEAEPVADNATAEGRASNRRVEFRVLSR